MLQARPAGTEATAAPEHLEFEVVGIVEEADSAIQYAICYSERADEFIVTNTVGELLSDDGLAQEILADFLDQAGDAEEGEAT